MLNSAPLTALRCLVMIVVPRNRTANPPHEPLRRVPARGS
jgi:hypothetical protein